MDEMPPIPNFLQRTNGVTMTTPEKKTRQPRMTPVQKSIFYANAEIAMIDKKLAGTEALRARREQLQEAIKAMPKE